MNVVRAATSIESMKSSTFISHSGVPCVLGWVITFMEMSSEPALLATMVAQIPPGVVWTSFAIGRMQMPWVAQSVLLGGHVRVGLEDNLYLGRGNKVGNAALVANAVTIITAMGAEVATPDDARAILQIGSG